MLRCPVAAQSATGRILAVVGLFAVLVVGSPASAGLAVPGAGSGSFTAYLAEVVPTAMTPLFPAGSGGELARCDAAAPPTSHAILVAAPTPGGDAIPLRGPPNDVRLLSQSLQVRGVAADDIVVLSEADAGRDRLRDAFDRVVAATQCNDTVFFYFGGYAVAPALLETILRGRFDKDGNANIADFASSDEADALHRFRDAGLFMLLEESGASAYDMVSADDLSEFVTRIRNRSADVTVILDTNSASKADISGRQARLAEPAFWRSDVNAEAPGAAPPPEVAIKPTPLVGEPGDYALFYSSIGEQPSMEMKFDAGNGERVDYGVFTFRIANAIQNASDATVRAVRDRVKTAVDGGDQATALTATAHRIEATDPDLPIFAGLDQRPPAPDPIIILKPTTKRGTLAMEEQEVDIEGRVAWRSAPRVVLVGSEQAELGKDGVFHHTVPLQGGLNKIDIIALTADGRTHEKTLEIFYQGDRKALEGSGTRYALIIANQNYGASTGFERLRTPAADADALAKVLSEKYGFTTEARLPDGKTVSLLLHDATRHDIEVALYYVGLAAGENDTVLIYYAGHGVYEQVTTTAFWVPVDATAGVPISYLSASFISESIQRMQAGKIILISDSCYSGALLRGGGDAAPAIDPADRLHALLRLADRRSRVLISSGGNEPVEDLGGSGHSIFAQALLSGLERFDQDAFSARELFDQYVFPMVIGHADQEPQYRPIERSGHDGGDVVFIRAGAGIDAGRRAAQQ